MTTSEFPSNSKEPRPANDKKIEQVTVGEVVSKKKSLGKRFKEVFVGGDSRSVLQYIMMDVLVPQAKDMFVEAASQGFEKLIYGEARPTGRRHGARPGTPANSNYTNYNRYATRGNNPIGRFGREERPTPNAQARTHGIDDILLASRVEAETVLDRMYDLVGDYESASVADLYSLIGWSSSYMDQKWGWTDLQGSGIQRTNGGYILNLPKPVSLD